MIHARELCENSIGGVAEFTRPRNCDVRSLTRGKDKKADTPLSAASLSERQRAPLRPFCFSLRELVTRCIGILGA